MLTESLLIVLSIGLLLFGAEGFVRGSSALAIRLKISPFAIGLTLVAFGTSLPELVVSLQAASAGHADIALGNIVGSNIFNIGIILGISALICPIPVNLKIVKFDAPLALLVAAIFSLMIADGSVGRIGGIALVAGLIAYLVFTFLPSRREATQADFAKIDAHPPQAPHSIMLDLVFIVAGLATLISGSHLLVTQATVVAQHFGVNDAIIGLTIVAAGTSMPELSTSIVAALRKQSDIAIGNVVGSNLFNILGIAGLTCTAYPIINTNVTMVDYLVMVFLSALLLPLLWTGKRLIRIEGSLLIGLYLCYLWYLWPN